MTARRLLMAAIGMATILTLTAAAFACSDNGGDESSAPQGEAEESSDLEAARSFIDQMTSAAEAGDLETAETAFESAHDPLHELIETLEVSDGDLAAELDEAVDHAEEAFAEGEEAGHVVEEAAEIAELLEQASTALGS